jgi:putative flippase GtrA
MDELAISPPPRTSNHTTLLSRAPRLKVIARFLATGGIVAVVHLSLVSAMVLLGVDIQLALIASYVVSLSIHFTLNRQWVFATDQGYVFHFTLQGARYLATAGLSYGCTAAALAVLPDALGLPELAVFFLASGVMAVVSFVLLNTWVFRSGPRAAE